VRTTHVAPGDSAGGSLRQAIREAGLDDEVLSFRDDLSCGPIDSDEPAARLAWWAQFVEGFEEDNDLQTFWDRAEGCNDRIVVWFARHSARELAFFLAWADRFRDRSYDILDVTGQRWPIVRPGGSTTQSEPARLVSYLPPYALKLLLGRERTITPHEREESSRHWQRLKRENAPLRIVTTEGLASTSIDYFDSLLLQCATARWQKAARVIGEAMGRSSEPYYQIGDLMLLMRMVALIGEGKLLAHGDPWKMRFCEIRLPD
jgi:Protein of unknown function/Domain of unknown function (DUF1835)